MADKKISALTGATTPLAGTEVLPIVQGGSTVKVSIANVTAGRAVSTGALSVGTADITLDNAYALKGKLVAGTAVTMMRRNSSDQVAIDEDGYGAKIGFGGRYNFAGGGDFTVGIGNVVLGTAGKGIDFSANTHAAGMTSELLNDYEEGTWTATISDGTTDATMNAGRRTGTYTKVGRQVTVTGYIATTSMTGVTGNLRMKGLPFTAGNNDVGGGAVGYCDGSMTFASGNVMTLQTQNGADYIVIRYWSGASGTVNMPGTLWGAAGEIGFTLTYFV